MLRKRLALLLALSWVILSGYDVIEDLDFLHRIELQNSLYSFPRLRISGSARWQYRRICGSPASALHELARALS